ncbi:hypothetical protein [Aeromonas veronii]|uniref:hypothetical protein n=1 Tax=Aeromonas veronii TaxID=654 RepID=UPI002B45DE5B|nr:hypothetical protein [Aeromonas veronii]
MSGKLAIDIVDFPDFLGPIYSRLSEYASLFEPTGWVFAFEANTIAFDPIFMHGKLHVTFNIYLRGIVSTLA